MQSRASACGMTFTAFRLRAARGGRQQSRPGPGSRRIQHWTAHHAYCIERAAQRTQRAAGAVRRVVKHRMLAGAGRVAVRMQREYMRRAHRHAPAATGAAAEVDGGDGLVRSVHARSMPCDAMAARGNGYRDRPCALGISRAATIGACQI